MSAVQISFWNEEIRQIGLWFVGEDGSPLSYILGPEGSSV